MAESQLKIYARGPDGIVVLQGKPGPGLPSSQLSIKESAQICFNDQGSMYCSLSPTGVTVHDAATDKQVFASELPRVLAAAFSPQGTYLIIFQRPTADTKGEKNLSVVHIASGETKLHLYEKNFTKDTWPSMQWSSDESRVGRLVNNEVHFYDTSNFDGGIAAKLRCPGVATLGVAPAGAGADTKFCVFVPELKGAPGSVRVHSVSQLAEQEPKPLARRSFFKCTEVKFHWNSTGTAVLVFATCDVDKSNQSYYGESNLHFLKADGSHEGNVPLGKEGPIHDLQWAPNGKAFVVVYGFMPAKATLFDDKCKPIYEFGSGPWNTVRWSPHSRFLCLCGFGNLPGDMEFFDKKADGKCKPMGAVKMACTVTCEWSPCGRHVLLATTAPRLRVDNGFKVLNYRGEICFEQECQTLYEACWRPVPVGTFEDRPQSPRANGEAGTEAAKPAPAKPAAYRPPHRASGGIPGMASLSLSRDNQDSAGKYKPPTQTGVVGAEQIESASAKKNRKKREAAARKKAEGGS